MKLAIKHTESYKKFSILPMNREIRSKHVEELVESIRNMGIIRPVVACQTNVIEGEDKLYIIDGQHLATALERENMQIPYTTIEVEDEKDLIHKMGKLNNSSKSWVLIDYVNAYKFCNNDYRTLLKYKNLYNLEIMMAASICRNQYAITSNSKTIKSGTFSVSNPQAEQMCKDFSDIFLKLANVDRSIKFSFLNAFIQSYDKITQDQVIDNLDKNIKRIKLIADLEEAKSFIRAKVFNIKK
jgi:hypothetical protein